MRISDLGYVSCFEFGAVSTSFLLLTIEHVSV